MVFNTDYCLNVGQKYCRMPQGEHSAILLIFIKLSYSIKTFALSVFKCKTGFTVAYIEFLNKPKKNPSGPRHLATLLK